MKKTVLLLILAIGLLSFTQPRSKGSNEKLTETELEFIKENYNWNSGSNPMILNQTSVEYRPIVQIIDSLQRNHKLGLILELKVGERKLLVCMVPASAVNEQTRSRAAI